MMQSKLIPAVLFIVTVLGALFYVNPLIDEHTAVVQAVEDKRTKIDEVNKQKTDLQKVADEFSALSEQEKKRRLSAFPPMMDQESIITSLVNIMQDESLTLGSLNFSKSTTQGSPKKLSIVANISGTNDKNIIVDVVKGVEQAQRLLNIQSLAFLLNKGRQEYTLTMEGYYK